MGIAVWLFTVKQTIEAWSEYLSLWAPRPLCESACAPGALAGQRLGSCYDHLMWHITSHHSIGQGCFVPDRVGPFWTVVWSCWAGSAPRPLTSISQPGPQSLIFFDRAWSSPAPQPPTFIDSALGRPGHLTLHFYRQRPGQPGPQPLTSISQPLTSIGQNPSLLLARTPHFY